MAEEKNRQMIQYHFFATKEQAEQIEKRMRKIGVRKRNGSASPHLRQQSEPACQAGK